MSKHPKEAPKHPKPDSKPSHPKPGTHQPTRPDRERIEKGGGTPPRDPKK